MNFERPCVQSRGLAFARGWPLRVPYRTLETPGTNRLRDAQAAVDSAVRAAYGMKESEDTLSFLLRLNLKCAAIESKAQPIIPLGIPALVTNSSELITTDHIEPR